MSLVQSQHIAHTLLARQDATLKADTPIEENAMKRGTTEIAVAVWHEESDESHLFRVTVRCEQLREIDTYEDYAAEVFGRFKIVACSALELDADECRIGRFDGLPTGTFFTGDISDGTLLLH